MHPPPLPPPPVRVQPVRTYFSQQDVNNLNSTSRRLKIAALLVFNRVRSDAEANALVASGVLESIIDHVLDNDDDSIIRDRALWVLINLTSAPGDTGAKAILRLRPNFFTTIAENIVLQDPPNVINYLWCLGNMASSVPAQAQAMLDSEFHTICVNLLRDPRADRQAHQYAAFLLSNLAPHASQLVAHEIMTQLEEIPPIVTANHLLLVDLFWAINRLYLTCRHAEIQTSILLVNNLDANSNKIVKPAIETVADICSSNNSALISVMVTAGLLEKLHGLFNKPMFSPVALFCLSNIACEVACIPRMLEMPGLLLDVLTFADRSRDAIWTVCNLVSRGDAAAGRAVLRCGAGAQMLRRYRESIDPVQVIIIESVHSLLSKCGAVAWGQLRSGLGALPESHTNPHAAGLLVAIRRLAAQYADAGFAAPITAEPVPDIDPRPLSVAADVAAARMTEALARADGRFVVDVSDLVFTGADVAHLVGLGYIFRADGTLVATNP